MLTEQSGNTFSLIEAIDNDGGKRTQSWRIVLVYQRKRLGIYIGFAEIEIFFE